MKKIRKEDFAILNESEMNATKGGIQKDRPIEICDKREFILCYANYNVHLPFPFDKEEDTLWP